MTNPHDDQATETVVEIVWDHLRRRPESEQVKILEKVRRMLLELKGHTYE